MAESWKTDTDDYEEGVKESWERELQRFKDHMYPIFASFGIDFQTAMLLFQQNGIANKVDEVIELLENNKGFE